MAQNFLPCDREQELLLPPSLREWLPEDHLAWFVLDAVAALDLEAFYASYRRDGWSAPGSGQVPQDWQPGTGTIITGAAADKVEAAASAESAPVDGRPGWVYPRAWTVTDSSDSQPDGSAPIEIR